MTPSGNRHRADQTATPYPRCGKEHHGVDFAAVLRPAGGHQGQEQAGSVPARQVDRKRESPHQHEAEGPSCIQIEPAP